MQSKLNQESGALLDTFITHNSKFPNHWDKYEVGLILSGFKRATVWFVTSNFGSDISHLPAIDQYVVDETIRFLESLDLLAEATKEDIVNEGYEPNPYRRRIVILIARDVESMALNRELWGDRSYNADGPEFGGYPDNDELYGKLSGYPQTAIDAYVSGNSFKASEMPREIVASPAFAVMRFAPSKDHWREELAQAEAWIEPIKSNMPNVYNLMLKDINEIRNNRHEHNT
jgi:hypothetical protein